MNWSEEQLTALLRGRNNTRQVGELKSPPFKLPANQAGAFALGRMSVGKMNKTEVAYDAHLQEQHHAGQVLWHKFEGVKLRLANNTFLTVDFAVLPSTGVIELHEVKGWMMDDANVKLKVAASIYPFRFILVRKKKGGGWEREEFS
jgi:hypothetical protein